MEGIHLQRNPRAPWRSKAGGLTHPTSPKLGELSGVAILRTIKGYEDCNEATEVLEMLKGGFGLTDAPHLFTCRVDEVFVSNGAKPTCSESRIYLRLSAPNDGHVLSSRGGSATSRTDLP